jgi:adenosylcobinamide-GDP ribazoletransferase
MKREINIFFTALSFFTRIPFPQWAQFEKEYQHEAIKYFPLSGIIIGGLSGAVFYAANLLLPLNLSLILCMGFTVLFTGGLHEDGFMDVCDGFGGGWTKERILAIMKDSLIGAFGVTGLVFMVLSRFFGLQAIDAAEIPMVLMAAHSVSRLTATTFVNTHKYARVENSKASDYTQRISTGNMLVAFLLGLLTMLFLPSYKYLIILLPVFLSKYLMGRYFNKWIGGFTGDCIGATQQVGELVFYISYIAASSYI